MESSVALPTDFASLLPPFSITIPIMSFANDRFPVSLSTRSVSGKNKTTTRFLFTLLSCIVLAGVGRAALPTVRIMPYGDSITDGAPVPGGYRAPLYQLLTNAGYKVDFVGNATDNGASQLPDSNHEGHSGYRIDQLDSEFAGWVNAIPDPDIILLLIGTNDYGSGQDTAHATNRLDHLIWRITSNRPNAKLIVANLLLRTDNTTTYNLIRTTFNPFVPALVAKHAALGEQVYFLDLNSQLLSRDLADGLHPNQTGYRKMATNWFGAITNLIGPLGSTNIPVVSRATGRPGWTNIVVTFSKPVGSEATNIANFALSGGLTILGATLDPPGQRDVTLLTTPQTPSRFYTVTASNIYDLTENHLLLAPGAAATFLSAPTTNVLNNVPEAADYTLVYSLNIPTVAIFDTRGVPYTVDSHTNVPNFSRVAYYLELQRIGGTPQFIWVSMDAFTCDAGRIGLPLTTNSGSAQRYVTNMNVLSSVAGIINGNGLSGGYLEFWPTQYTGANTANVPDASGVLFYWGDQKTSGRYGSMQIHNVTAAQTLFAYNNWANGGTSSDLGIGNSTDANPDWTFSANAGSYTIKRLQVYVLATPTFAPGPDQTVLEDAPPQTVSNWVTHITPRCPFETNHTVEFIVNNDNNALFSVQPSVGPEGTLTYTLAPNANGTALISVRLHDDRGSGGQDLSLPQNFRISVLPVNDPPIAVARAFPLVTLSPGDTNVFIIARNNIDATLYFDASASSDVDHDALQFSWFIDDSSTSFATGVVATKVLGVGSHSIRLVVSDSLALTTNYITVEVITLGQAVEKLIDLVNHSELSGNDINPLTATLSAARASFDRDNFIAGLNQLGAFQNKSGAQITPSLAQVFIRAAQIIMGASEKSGTPSKITRVTSGPHRETLLQLNGDADRIHLIQGSTNLADWENVGIAIDLGAGLLGFEDRDAARFPNRYYRIVSP